MTTTDTNHGLVIALEISVYRALSRAGNWLLARHWPRADRRRFRDTPLDEIHVHLPVEQHNLDDMLQGAWRELEKALPNDPCVHELVRDYVTSLLIAGQPHRRSDLEVLLAETDCVMAA